MIKKTDFTAWVILLFGVVIISSVLLFKEFAVYITLFAVGLSLALQKYVASFFGYFVIRLSGAFKPGERVRIGNLKGEIKHIGLFHFLLKEIGEEEKLGGEFTGRVIYVPNLLLLDQPVINYSKYGDYIFDEIRIPLSTKSDVNAACDILEGIIRKVDAKYIEKARQIYLEEGEKRFIDDTQQQPKILVHLDPKVAWIEGKFVTPVMKRNSMRTLIYLEFMDEINKTKGIELADK